jgi:hypothetical protein
VKKGRRKGETTIPGSSADTKSESDETPPDDTGLGSAWLRDYNIFQSGRSA